ncbi:MAG: citrate synthase [Candidatus Electrothrix sp. ATG2]|nr:citrate synthase [Candidatus Electrothrix sp. ATG2]
MQLKEKKRQASFATRIVTRIWDEQPCADNPYLADRCRCHGYDMLELLKKKSYIEILYLLFMGELPTPAQSELLESLFIAFINPGPRHPATRTAMNAGVGKTYSHNILPISIAILGGGHLGGEEVTGAMYFLRKNQQTEPNNTLVDILAEAECPDEGDWHIVPGFGNRFNGIDPMPGKIANKLLSLPGSGKAIAWGNKFASVLKPHGMGWLSTGVVAAVLCDLGFHPRAGAGLFQLLSGPGLLAHGLELANKPITAMPFPDGTHYVISEKAKTRKK